MIVKYDDNEYGYKLCYLKNAISIIENVVYAYDSERKWIQTHPIVSVSYTHLDVYKRQQNMRASATLWLWSLKDFAIIVVLSLIHI